MRRLPTLAVRIYMKNIGYSSHVAVKTTTYEGKIDTDHVTRVTVVQWKENDGTIKTIQFNSMEGYHTRVSE